MQNLKTNLRQKKRSQKLYNFGHHIRLLANSFEGKMDSDKPHQKWVTAVTHIKTYQGNFYLAVIIDVYSRQIVGYSTGTCLNSALQFSALKMAILDYQPSPGLILENLENIDIGNEKFLTTHEITVRHKFLNKGISSVVPEYFFRALRREISKKSKYKTYAIAQKEIVDYVKSFYNQERPYANLTHFKSRQLSNNLSLSSCHLPNLNELPHRFHF